MTGKGGKDEERKELKITYQGTFPQQGSHPPDHRIFFENPPTALQCHAGRPTGKSVTEWGQGRGGGKGKGHLIVVVSNIDTLHANNFTGDLLCAGEGMSENVQVHHH